jgi:hypothetical protein
MKERGARQSSDAVLTALRSSFVKGEPAAGRADFMVIIKKQWPHVGL